MARATHDDVSVFSFDAGSFLTTDWYEGVLSFMNETIDGQGIGELFTKKCITRKSAALDIQLTSSNANCKVTGLDMTAVTLASIDLLDYLESLDISITNSFVPVDGVSDEWTERQYVGPTDFSASLVLNIDTNAADEDNLIIGAASSTLTNSNVALAFTINSVQFTVDMVILEAKHTFTRGDIQRWEFTLGQRAAPTNPTGTSSLLTKAINAPGTAQALLLTSKTAGGVAYGGNFLPESVTFNVNRTSEIITNYRYINDGAVTAAATV